VGLASWGGHGANADGCGRMARGRLEEEEMTVLEFWGTVSGKKDMVTNILRVAGVIMQKGSGDWFVRSIDIHWLSSRDCMVAQEPRIAPDTLPSFFYLGYFVCHIGLLRSFSDNFVCCLLLLDQGHSFDDIIYHHHYIILFHYLPFAVVHHIFSFHYMSFAVVIYIISST
jgi:hypothetical protein